MSLVAYGSSGDSSGSDNEEPSVDVKLGENVTPEFEVAPQTEINPDLPAPKSSDITILDESDELEDEVKPKPSQVADLKKPEPKKIRQSVKITIPALPDSDEEDDQPKKKTIPGPTTYGKFGLTAILPPPVHAAKKETNRILMPYSLSKKQNVVATKSGVKKSSDDLHMNTSKRLKTSLANSDTDSDEDDGEPVNFFSLDTKTKSLEKEWQTHVPATPPNTPIHPGLNMGVPIVNMTTTFPLKSHLNLPAPSKNWSHSETVVLDKSQEMDMRIDSGSSNSLHERLQSHNEDDLVMVVHKDGLSRDKESDEEIWTSGRDQNVPIDENTCGSQYPEADDTEAFKQDAEFLRLQGKKQHGREEINIIDVNADDFTNPSELTKHLTEEQAYQSHRKKDNQPSSQQKRKHQIHYLAFQAKERELELQNQWSQNKQTKKQTQAKYGF